MAMTIGEAENVAALLSIITGNWTDSHEAPDRAVDAALFLASRASKPLQLTLAVDVDQLRANVARLLAVQACEDCALDDHCGDCGCCAEYGWEPTVRRVDTVNVAGGVL